MKHREVVGIVCFYITSNTRFLNTPVYLKYMTNRLSFCFFVFSFMNVIYMYVAFFYIPMYTVGVLCVDCCYEDSSPSSFLYILFEVSMYKLLQLDGLRCS